MVVTVRPEIAPNSSTIQIYSMVLDRTAPQLKNITYDQNSRKFKIGDIVKQGSGLKYVELSYDKNGETVVIPQSADKEWIIPDALELGQRESSTVKQSRLGYIFIPDEGAAMTDGCAIDPRSFARTLRDQRRTRMKGGLYHLNQVLMAYNSNRIEGSRLDEEQTRYIYETRTITGENVAVDDVVEAVNSFELFDEMIDRLGEPITAETMKDYHRILKRMRLLKQLQY